MEPQIIRPSVLQRKEIVVCTAVSRPDFEPAVHGKYPERDRASFGALWSNPEGIEALGMSFHYSRKLAMRVCSLNEIHQCFGSIGSRTKGWQVGLRALKRMS